MARWGMVIDLDKCTGCQACTVACKEENNVPHGSPEENVRRTAPYWHKVIAASEGEYPSLNIEMVPMPCMQCDNPPCVNPEHLFIGTRNINNKDRAAKGRTVTPNMNLTHCKRGHEFTPENTITRITGTRLCRTCNNEGARRRQKEYRR